MAGTVVPTTTARVDKGTFYIASTEGSHQVFEVDGVECSRVLSSFRSGSGAVLGLASSTTSTGQSFVCVVLEGGVVEVWDVATGAYTFVDLVVLPPVGSKERGGAGAASSTKGGARAGPVIVGSVGHASASVFFLSQQPAGPATLTGAYTSSTPPVLQVLRVCPSMGGGEQRLDALDNTRRKTAIVCLACHASRPLVGVGFSDGLCRLYDYSRATLDRGGGGGMGPIAGGDTGEGDDEAPVGSAGLLLVPVASLRPALHNQLLSCLAFHPSAELLAAAGPGGYVGLWNMSEVQCTGAPVMDAPLPPVCSGATQPSSGRSAVWVSVVDFVAAGASPLVLAVVHEAPDVTGKGPQDVASFDPDVCPEAATGGTGRACRLVALAMLKNNLAVLAQSHRLTEPVKVCYSGAAGSVLILGPVVRGVKGARSSVVLSVELGHIVPPPVAAPLPVLPWPALLLPSPTLQQLGGAHALTATYISTSLVVPRSSRGVPVLRHRLVQQPLQHTQRRTEQKGVASGPRHRPLTFNLPASVPALRAAISKAKLEPTFNANASLTALLVAVEKEGDSLLQPTKVASVSEATVVLLGVVNPTRTEAVKAQVLQSSASGLQALAYPRPLVTDSPSVLLLVQHHSKAHGGESVLAHVGAAVDAAFLSPRFLAMLHEGGTQVSLLAQEPTSQAWQVIKTTPLSRPARRVFAAPEGLGGRPVAALYAVGLTATDLMGVINSSSSSSSSWLDESGTAGQSVDAPPTGARALAGVGAREAVLLSRKDGLGLALAGEGPMLVLQEGEKVVQATWQPSLSTAPPAAPADPLTQALPLLALLTTQRLLLLSSSLQLLASVPMSEPVSSQTSLCWLGPCLLHTNGRDGHVHYLAPGRTDSTPVCGLACVLSGCPGEGCVTLLGALPDRLVYVHRAQDARSGTGPPRGARLYSRVLLPLEPLLAGTLALPRVLHPALHDSLITQAAEEQSRGAVKALAEMVVERYGPTAVSLTGLNEGMGRNAGATSKAALLLCEAGLFRLAMAVAGISTDTRDEGAQAFRKRPWMPIELKAGIAAASRYWRTGMSEALADDPTAQEYALNPSSLRTAPMPLRQHPVAKVLGVLGEDASVCGQWEAALRLHDVAGDDAHVAQTLLTAALAGHHEALNILKELWQQGRASAPHLSHAYASHALSSSASLPPPPPSALLLSSRLTERSLPFASCHRRATLLPAAASASDELCNWPILDDTAATPTTPAASAGAGQASGPPRLPLLSRLLLDRVEEWMGKRHPEVMDPSDDATGTGAAAEEGGDEWVKGVGQGREEEDNVVGYWRFSEMTSAGTEGNVHKWVGDLSQYTHTIEVVSDGADSVTFEPSTSPVDPGDEAKVRPAFDAVWLSTPLGKASGGSGMSRGLLVPVRRGSALDVGSYHSQLPRCRLSLEMWVRRPEDTDSGAVEVLASRVTEEGEGKGASARQHIWTLSIVGTGAEAGALVLQGGGDATEAVKTTSGAIEAGRWTHVAMVMECRGRGGTQASASLLVAGKEAASGSLKFPTLPEPRLKNTMLRLGPDLRGHRLSEVRLWAVGRSADDVYDNRESYLKLAEKRKRLAFKIRATEVAGQASVMSALARPKSTASPMLPQALEAQPVSPLVPPSLTPVLSGGMVTPPPTGASPLVTAPPSGGQLSGAAARRRGRRAQGDGDENSASPGGLAPPPRGRSPSTSAGQPSPSSAQQGAQGQWSADFGAFERPDSAGSSRAATPASSATTPKPPSPVSPAVFVSSSGVPPSLPSPALTPPPGIPKPVSRVSGSRGTTPTPSAGGQRGGGSAETPSGPLVMMTQETPKGAVMVPGLPAPPSPILRLTDMGLQRESVLWDSRVSVFSDKAHSICVREQVAGTTQMAIVVVKLEASGARARYPFQAESVLLNGDVEEPVMACYTLAPPHDGTAGLLQVYNVKARQALNRQVVTTRLSFWRWVSDDSVCLVTPLAVFHWIAIPPPFPTPTGAAPGMASPPPRRPPSKVFDRADASSPLPVLDYWTVGAETGYALLLLAPNERGASQVQIRSLGLGRTFVETEVMGVALWTNQAANTVCMATVRASGDASAALELRVSRGLEAELGGATATALSQALTQVACVPLPHSRVPSCPQHRSCWVFALPHARSIGLYVLLADRGLLYHYSLEETEGAQGSAVLASLVSGRVKDACLAGDGGHLLVLEEGTLGVVSYRLPAPTDVSS